MPDDQQYAHRRVGGGEQVEQVARVAGGVQRRVVRRGHPGRLRTERHRDRVPGLAGTPGRRAQHEVRYQPVGGEPGAGRARVGVPTRGQGPVRVRYALRVGRLRVTQQYQCSHRYSLPD